MDDLGTLLQNKVLARVADQLEQLAQPSIRIISTARGESELALGTSKVGGLPDLSEDIAWPTWKDMPLAFIAQINLAEVHPLDVAGLLPVSGLLSFFYDADHVPVGYDPAWRGGWCVLYDDGEHSRLQRVSIPPALLTKEPTWLPKGQQYAECALRFALERTLPPASSTSLESLQLFDQERKAYWKVLAALEQRLLAPSIAFSAILMPFREICRSKVSLSRMACTWGMAGPERVREWNNSSQEPRTGNCCYNSTPTTKQKCSGVLRGGATTGYKPKPSRSSSSRIRGSLCNGHDPRFGH